MRCAGMEELISAYANDELTPEKREQVERHLANCAACRDRLAEYLRVRQQMEGLRVAPTGPDIRAAVMSKIRSAPVPAKQPKAWGRRILIAVPVAAALVALFIMQPWVSSFAPEKVLARAHSAIEGLNSYRFSLTRDDDPEGVNSRFEAEFAAPNRYHIKQTLNGESQETILIGDTQYYKGKFSSSLGARSQTAMYSSMLSKEGTLDWLNTLTDIRELPVETLEGAICFHYQGTYDVEKMLRAQAEDRNRRGAAPPMSEAELQQRVRDYNAQAGSRSTELWIGKDDYLLRQLRVSTQPPDNSGRSVSSTTYRFSGFNEDIVIEAPVDSGGKLLAGWATTAPERPAFEKEVRAEIDNYDPENRRIDYSVKLTNISGERLSRLNVNIARTYAGRDAILAYRITGGPTGPSLYELGPGESFDYVITFTYNAVTAEPQKVVDFIRNSPLYIGYVTAANREREEFLYFEVPDSVYTLPANPPTVRNLVPVGKYRIEEPNAVSSGRGVSGKIDGKDYLFLPVENQRPEAPLPPGILVLNVQDPATPVRAGYLGAAGDIRVVTDLALQGTTLYVCTDSSLWIVDVSDPAAPREVARMTEVRPVTIAISGNYAYVNSLSQKISAIDISDPARPQLTSTSDTLTNSSLKLEMAGDYLVAWAEDTLYTIDISSAAALRVVNSLSFSFPANLEPSLRVSPPHIRGRARVGDYAYVVLIGEGEDGIAVIDLSDPASPLQIGFVGFRERQTGGELFAAGNRIFMFSRDVMDFRERLEFIDVSDPAKPVEAGFGRLPDYWDFFGQTAAGAYHRSYRAVGSYLYWGIGNPPNQPVIGIFDLAVP